MKAVEAFGHVSVPAADGDQAWQKYHSDSGIRIVVTDWMVPNSEGLQLCRRIREIRQRDYTYIILLTVGGGKEIVLEGLEAGADDVMTKPFDWDELEARIGVAQRILGFPRKSDQPRAMLPICSYCKSMQDERANWVPVESYITTETLAELSHTICPECFEKEVKPQMAEWSEDADGAPTQESSTV